MSFYGLGALRFRARPHFDMNMVSLVVLGLEFQKVRGGSKKILGRKNAEVRPAGSLYSPDPFIQEINAETTRRF